MHPPGTLIGMGERGPRLIYVGAAEVPVADGSALVLRGRTLAAEHRRVLASGCPTSTAWKSSGACAAGSACRSSCSPARTSGGDKVAALLTEPGLGHPFQP